MTEKLSRAPMTHTVKCVPPFFEEVWTGRKGFEIRLNDRDFRDGDTIIQREYLPDAQEYTGRETAHRVGYVLRDYPALAENHVAFTLLPCAARAEARPAPAVDREAVARIVDPIAFKCWQAIYDYGRRIGDSELEALETAEWAHGKSRDEALAKADAILALLSPATSPGEGSSGANRAARIASDHAASETLRKSEEG